MSSPFPLLRLPRLVLCEVFKSLRIGEKIKLSLCSKRISTQINYDRLYSQKVIVDLDWSSQKIGVQSENHEDIFEIAVRVNYKIGHQGGFLTVVRYLLKMFRCKISIDSSYYNIVQIQPVISELFDLQLEFKELTICLDRSEDHILLFNQISSNFGLVEDLSIISFHVPACRPVFTSWPQNISIENSAWFTLKSLLTCTCTTIRLEDSHLKNKDLDEILKNWKAGGFPNLVRLKIISQNITNNGTTILGMNLEELAGKVIQTDDGSKKATIKLRPHNIKMSVTPSE